MDSTRSLIARYLSWLAATYPRAFDRRRPVPLDLGTYEVLLADPDRPPWATARVVSGALAAWTRRPKYRSAVKHISRRALVKETHNADTTGGATPAD